jgi:sn-glycerol 3-phosphate transport system permease protein
LALLDTLGNPGAFVGLRNFIRILNSDSFKRSVIATAKYAGMVGVGTFSLGMFLSFLCVNKSRGSKIYQTMFALPIALASAPIAALAIYILGRNGLLNGILGTSMAWLSQRSTALTCLAFVASWANVGSTFIFLLVGFRNVSDDLIESATIDGAGYFRRFINIYIPIASPQIFFVIFLNIITSFKSFALIKILVGSGPSESTNVLIYAIYSNAFYRGRFETACVYSLVLCLVIFVVTRIQLLFEKRMVHYQ